MNLVFSENAWQDYLYWLGTDRNILNTINNLIKEIQRSPHQGIGKPEPLRHELAGYWSRRITREHRIVYKVEGDAVFIAQLRFHC